MVRARLRKGVLFSVVAAAAAAALAPLGGPSAAAGQAPQPVSPSGVLAQLRQRSGPVAMGLPFGHEQPPPSVDRSLAPYLTIIGEGHDGSEQVPLRSTSAVVDVAGVIARVQVKQQFQNSGRVPIEAVYVFPASTRAAVHAVRMTIGDRTIEAQIDRRQAARETYEAARSQGRRAALLEQERANVFSMNVANIMPGDVIDVALDYSEMLVPDDGVYELCYPTVVGPRYAGGADPARDRWMANPHLPAGTLEPYRFDIRVHLEMGIAIRDLASPSHAVTVDYTGPARADVRLAAAGGGNRDFVLRYRLAGEKIESGLLLWEGEGGGGRRENFFALMLEPPRRPQAAEIPPREYIFLLDVSGSMHGFPLETAKVLMRNLLGRLRPTDYFNVALFSGAAEVVSPGGSMRATKEAVAAAIARIEHQQGGGGTELMGGLEMSYRIPRVDGRVARSVVVVTDGYVGVEAQAFRFIRERLSEANLFAFGIGNAVNRGLIEGMARAGQGEPFVVARPEAAAATAEKLRAYIEQPVLTHVKAGYGGGFDAYEVAPQALPDLMARRPLLLFGKYRGGAQGTIEVSGTTGGGAWRTTVAVRPADVRPANAALRWLWARRWVETLDDERTLGAGQPAEEAITTLGLDYHLLTAFTSFVAVDSQVANAGGASRTVRQPLPMPEGVSNLAVAGASMGTMAQSVPHSAMRMMAPPTAVQAAPPMPTPTGGRISSLEGLGAGGVRAKPAVEKRKAVADKDDLDSGALEGKAEPPELGVTVTNATLLGPTDALVRALRAALEKSGPQSCTLANPRGPITLRLSIDAAGRVRVLSVRGADAATERCLRSRLSGLTSATVAAGKTAAGTVEVRIATR